MLATQRTPMFKVIKLTAYFGRTDRVLVVTKCPDDTYLVRGAPRLRSNSMHAFITGGVMACHRYICHCVSFIMPKMTASDPSR